MTILVLSWLHAFAGTSRSRRRARFIPAPASAIRHHPPVLNQAVGRGGSGQSAVISGFPLSAILRKLSPRKAATT